MEKLVVDELEVLLMALLDEIPEEGIALGLRLVILFLLGAESNLEFAHMEAELAVPVILNRVVTAA